MSGSDKHVSTKKIMLTLVQRITLFVIGMCLTSGAFSAQLVESTCFSINLPNEKVCLFEDNRLSAAAKDEYWQGGDLDGHLKDYHPAELHLLNSTGQLLDKIELNKVLAKLEKSRLHQKNLEIFLVSEDYSAGFGSYSGPSTRPFFIENTRVNFIEPTGSKRNPYNLVSTLKSAWREVPDGFLQVFCRPDFSNKNADAEFTITYERVQLTGDTWVVTENSESGLWEYDDEAAFPDESKFPKRKLGSP